MSRKKTRVLVPYSGGGHRVQILRQRPAFVNCDVVVSISCLDYNANRRSPIPTLVPAIALQADAILKSLGYVKAAVPLGFVR